MERVITMTTKEKNANYEKRFKILFVTCVTLVIAVILVGLGWYAYYMRTTTLISELQAVGPSGDQVVEDYDGRLSYVFSSSGSTEGLPFRFTAQFACFEGEMGKMWNSESSKTGTDEILDLYKSLVKVRGKEVTDWSTDKITYPIYSVKFNLREGGGISKSFCGVWTNGYFITSASKVYKLDYDFSKFEEAGDTLFPYSEVERDGKHWMLWPITLFKSRTEDGEKWNADVLTPSIFDVTEMEGLTMTVKDVDLESYQRTITIELRNDGTSDIKYGTMLHMETCVDGKWYQPLVDMNGAQVTGVDSLMNTLHPGETKTVTYKVMAYQNRPKAQNRAILYVYKDGVRTHVAAPF